MNVRGWKTLCYIAELSRISSSYLCGLQKKKRKEKQRLFSEHTILSLLESLLRNTSTSYLCLALTKCLLIKNVHCEIYIEKQHKSVLGWAHGFVQNSSTIVLHANSKVLRFHVWLNRQSFCLQHYPHSSVVSNWNIQSTYDCLFPPSHRFSPSCPPIHLHILTRWSLHSNSRLWSHRMPAPCVHFPLFVSPWPRTHMEARTVSCRQA